MFLEDAPDTLAQAVVLTAARDEVAAQSKPPEQPDAATERASTRRFGGGGKWDPFGAMRRRFERHEVSPPPPPLDIDNDDDVIAPVNTGSEVDSFGVPAPVMASTNGHATNGSSHVPEELVVAVVVEPVAAPFAEPSRVGETAEALAPVVTSEPALAVPNAAGEEEATVEEAPETRDFGSFLFAGLDLPSPSRATAMQGQWAIDFYGHPMESPERREAIVERVVGLAIAPNEAALIYRDDADVREALWAAVPMADDNVRRRVVAMALLDADEIRVTDAIDIAFQYNDLDLIDAMRTGPYADYVTMRDEEYGVV